MKVGLSFVFAFFSFLGFSQSDQVRYSPVELNYLNVEVWSYERPEIIDIETEIKESREFLSNGSFILLSGHGVIFIDGVKVSSELPKQKEEVEFISEGLLACYGGSFISPHQKQLVVWNKRTLE